MKNLRLTFSHRDRERGAVALMIAVMWTALFGMAVVAVDFGYLYTKKRGVQSTADSALRAAMPQFRDNGATAAQNRALQVTRLNNYQDSEVSFPTVPAGQFSVQITRSHPTFFGGLFGLGSRNIHGTSTGQLTGGGGGAAIHAIDATSCGIQWVQQGIELTGNGKLMVNGNMESMSHIHIGTLDSTCNPAVDCRTTGTVKTGCPAPMPESVWNDDPAHFGLPPASYSTPTPDPLAGHDLPWFEPKCNNGTSTLTNVGSTPTWIPALPPCVGDTLAANSVICSNNDIILNPPSGTICPTTAAFISAGVVQINTAGAVTLTAPGNTDGIVVFSNYNGGGNAVFLTNGPASQYTLNGHVYAPRGIIRAGSQAPGVTLNGMLDGNVVLINIGNFSTWTVGTGSSGPTSGWRVYR